EAEAAQPISPAVSPRVSGRCNAGPSEPTTVTSRPSSSQLTPSAMTTRQCQPDQGRRSRRAGMSLRISLIRSQAQARPGPWAARSGYSPADKEAIHEALHASGLDDQPSGAPVHRRAQHPGRGSDRRPDEGRPLQAALHHHQSQPTGAGAGRRGLPPDRILGDPEVPRRQSELARLSEGPQAARQSQRDDGLAEHPVLPRVRLRLHLPADLPQQQAPDRRGAAGLPGVVQGEGAELAQAPRPALARAARQLPLRRQDHHRRLPGRGLRLPGRDHPHGLRRLSEREALARQHEAAEKLGQGERGVLRLPRHGQRPAVRRAVIKGLHHNAYRCRDSEETRRFYEDFLGLPLSHTLWIKESKSGRRTDTLHTFYRMDDGSCLAFFEAPDMPFEFKAQHDYDLHIALEVQHADLMAMFEKGKRAGIETRGISDHGFIDSIYFRDPNGYVIELTAKREDHERAMDPELNRARRTLEDWRKRNV